MSDQPTALRTERVNYLALLRTKLKSGEYDGVDIMDACLAIDELRRLHEQVEALRADAERYRWLREESGKRPDFYSGEANWMVSRSQGGMGQNFFGEKIDAAIDAARSKT